MQKTWMGSLVVVVAMGVGGWLCGSGVSPANQKDDAGPNPVQKFMRVKLDDGKEVLEGLVTENYAKIQKATDHLQLMSKATEWHVLEGPVYEQHSVEFRRACDLLSKMAKEKKLDGATLAYMQVTMACINCHKHIKEVRVAQGQPAPAGLEAWTVSLAAAPPKQGVGR